MFGLESEDVFQMLTVRPEATILTWYEMKTKTTIKYTQNDEASICRKLLVKKRVFTREIVQS
jgi:hypothetical protein